MIRECVRRNLDAELLQGCEELLRMASTCKTADLWDQRAARPPPFS